MSGFLDLRCRVTILAQMMELAVPDVIQIEKNVLYNRIPAVWCIITSVQQMKIPP